ncbi:MAG: EAL domain-containing protein [Verrucomicrobiae bacterium]|nr:EAL domain-containing protein [Verrucomicrobiae bacterium]
MDLSASSTKNNNGLKASILIVEDESHVVEMVKIGLERYNYKIDSAATVDEAFQVLVDNSYEIVLTDLSLEERNDGLKILDALLPKAPDTAVVIMTGDTDVQTAINCLRNGAFDYVIKPFTMREMVDVVNRVYERRTRMVEQRNRIEEQIRVLGKFPSENPNPVMRIKIDGTLVYANAASQPMLQEWNCEIGDEVPEFLVKFIRETIQSEHRKDIEVMSNGRYFSFSITPIQGEDYVYVYGHDITRLKEAEQELIRLKNQAQDLALHDALTGLPNRILLEDRMQQAIAHSIRNGTKTAVAFIDLDNFKHINDSLGHKVGDQVLVKLATYLRQTVRKTDTVARWGGDEMILVLTDLHSHDEAYAVCERIRVQVQEKLKQDEIGIPATMSMGVAICPDDSDSPESLQQQADTALYVAKSSGRNTIVFFADTGYVKTFQHKMHLGNMLNLAVDDGKIIPHYQPIIDVKTGQTVAVEALARWFEPEVGWIPPATFIPMAEEAGLIDQLGEKMAKRAIEDLKKWRQSGLNITINLNVSLRQLFTPRFCEELLSTVAAYGLSPTWITLEITESQALVGSLKHGNPIEAAARAGFRLSIDDFGQGYSSLSSLQELSVHELKIDMKFVRNIKTEKGARIVQAIVELARILSLQTVAEGVEEREEYELLARMGVDRVQGFYFGAPMPFAELTNFVLSKQSLISKQ